MTDITLWLRNTAETMGLPHKNKLNEAADEIISLRAKNETLQYIIENNKDSSEIDLDSLDAEEKGKITFENLKSSYGSVASAYKKANNDEYRQYCKSFLNVLDGAIKFYASEKELTDWEKTKPSLEQK